MLKKIEWVNDNKMKFESQHKAFNRWVNCIGTGNMISDGQFSSYIRPESETECNGFTSPTGHLREFDLKPFQPFLPHNVREAVLSATKRKQMILYMFSHISRGERVIHGFILTESNYKLVRKFYINRSVKSRSVIDEAALYVSEP
jgi:hypothetical protein